MVTKKVKAKAKSVKVACCNWNVTESCNCGMSYLLGFFGAAIYYVSQATGVVGGIVGILKAIVWPAFLIHALLTFIGA
jgi:hypothetical protein